MRIVKIIFRMFGLVILLNPDKKLLGRGLMAGVSLSSTTVVLMDAMLAYLDYLTLGPTPPFLQLLGGSEAIVVS